MMNQTSKYYLFIVFIAFFATEISVAQNGGFAGASTRIGNNPRAMAMANSFTATTSEGIYPYYNPALAAENSGFKQVDLIASSLSFDRVFQTLNANFRLPPNAGISFGLIRTGVKDIDERTLSGYPQGSFDISEYQLFTAFGIQFNPRFNAGVAFKLGYANYHEELSPATSVGIDIGILYKINPNLNFGFTIQDMFANYTWNSSDLYGNDQSRNVVNTFPTRFKWGLAYQNEKFTFSGEFEAQSYNSETSSREIFIEGISSPTTIETTEEIATSSALLRFGGSWNAHERFTFRGGYKFTDLTTKGNGSFSTGFSVHLPFDKLSPSIDYAFVIEPYQVANMHVFALRLHL